MIKNNFSPAFKRVIGVTVDVRISTSIEVSCFKIQFCEYLFMFFSKLALILVLEHDLRILL